MSEKLVLLLISSKKHMVDLLCVCVVYAAVFYIVFNKRLFYLMSLRSYFAHTFGNKTLSACNIV